MGMSFEWTFFFSMDDGLFSELYIRKRPLEMTAIFAYWWEFHPRNLKNVTEKGKMNPWIQTAKSAMIGIHPFEIPTTSKWIQWKIGEKEKLSRKYGQFIYALWCSNQFYFHFHSNKPIYMRTTTAAKLAIQCITSTAINEHTEGKEIKNKQRDNVSRRYFCTSIIYIVL